MWVEKCVFQLYIERMHECRKPPQLREEAPCDRGEALCDRGEAPYENKWTFLYDVEGTHQVYQGEAEEHGDNTHDDAYLGHLVLLHKTRGKGQRIRWSGDGQNHSR